MLNASTLISVIIMSVHTLIIITLTSLRVGRCRGWQKCRVSLTSLHDSEGLAKELEQFRPFFLEDLFAPEDNDYFRLVQGIGRVITALEETGQLENTLILFLADNGGCAEELQGPANRRKGCSSMVPPVAVKR